MRESDRRIVRALPLFAGMQEAHFDALMGAALLQTFPARVQLIHEGELPDFLHVIEEGAVELYSFHNERETTIDIIVPTRTFILAAVILDEVYLNSARTLMPSRILMIPAEAVRAIFGRDGTFARAIVRELAQRYRSVVRSLKSHKLRTSTERLASWILEADARSGGSGIVTLQFEKRTLAALIGTTPENLSRSFAALSNHGVTSDGRAIVIADREALLRIAHPSELIDDVTR